MLFKVGRRGAMLLGGIDEAGRGPAIGPMTICLLTIEQHNLHKLAELGVKDSKQLSPEQREAIFHKLRKICAWELKVIPAHDIDSREDKSLNEMEIESMAALINGSRAEKVFIDSLEANPRSFLHKLKPLVRRNVSIVADTKGDVKFPACSAASIVAKVTRDSEVEKLKKRFGDFGSGYPHDEKTVEFLKEWYRKNKFFPIIVRKSWYTISRICGAESTDRREKPGKTGKTKAPIQKKLDSFAED